VNEARITNWNATVAYGATNYIFMHSCGPKNSDNVSKNVSQSAQHIFTEANIINGVVMK